MHDRFSALKMLHIFPYFFSETTACYADQDIDMIFEDFAPPICVLIT